MSNPTATITTVPATLIGLEVVNRHPSVEVWLIDVGRLPSPADQVEGRVLRIDRDGLCSDRVGRLEITEPGRAPTRAQPGSGRMVRVKQLFVLLLVVAATAVGADRAAAWEAGQVFSNKLASMYNLDQKPTVQVRGVPFLTQWESGQYEEIDAQLPAATADQVRITDISAQLHDIRTAAFVTSSADTSGATVGTAGVQGMVPYSNLPLPQGFQASAAGDRLHLTGSVRAGPLSIPVTATVRVGVQNGQLMLTAESVDASSSIAENTVAAIVRQQLEATSMLRNLPFGVQLQAVTVTQTGLQIAAVGHNLEMPR